MPYSLYGMTALSFSIDMVCFTAPIQEPILAVLAGGFVWQRRRDHLVSNAGAIRSARAGKTAANQGAAPLGLLRLAVFGLDLELSRAQGDVRVIVRVTGTALEPRLAFDSDPPMSQSDIMAYLLFGSSADDLDGAQKLFKLIEALEDDLNTPKAMAEFFALARALNKSNDPGEMEALAAASRPQPKIAGSTSMPTGQ